MGAMKFPAWSSPPAPGKARLHTASRLMPPSIVKPNRMVRPAVITSSLGRMEIETGGAIRIALETRMESPARLVTVQVNTRGLPGPAWKVTLF